MPIEKKSEVETIKLSARPTRDLIRLLIRKGRIQPEPMSKSKFSSPILYRLGAYLEPDYESEHDRTENNDIVIPENYALLHAYYLEHVRLVKGVVHAESGQLVVGATDHLPNDKEGEHRYFFEYPPFDGRRVMTYASKPVEDPQILLQYQKDTRTILKCAARKILDSKTWPGILPQGSDKRFAFLELVAPSKATQVMEAIKIEREAAIRRFRELVEEWS